MILMALAITRRTGESTFYEDVLKMVRLFESYTDDEIEEYDWSGVVIDKYVFLEMDLMIGISIITLSIKCNSLSSRLSRKKRELRLANLMRAKRARNYLSEQSKTAFPKGTFRAEEVAWYKVYVRVPGIRWKSHVDNTLYLENPAKPAQLAA